MGWSKCVKCGTEHNPFTACPGPQVVPKARVRRLKAAVSNIVSNMTPSVSNTVANVSNSVSNSRLSRWRATHAEAYRAYQRSYMAAKRANALSQPPLGGSQSRQDALGGANGAVTVAEGVG